ncbi:disintegrin and metalloproteinase domain-containing protein 15 isoform X2 [Hyperolius riggenbachi]|uniref:disintegrin and metalloproteinase domain-containing protein 15 isoform X2 n=1 Tax=Hyperolius riggenbachi TaxID=752182 RepID=UPI0035A31C75
MGGECWVRFILPLLSVYVERSSGTPAGVKLCLSDQVPHWEVFPQLSTSDGRPVTLPEVTRTPFDRLLLSLAINGTWIRMELQRNRHLTPDFHTLTYYLPDGTRVTDKSSQPVNCYYQGQLEGGRGPWSSFSLCSGLRGSVILSEGQQFSIEPVPGGGSLRHILQPVQSHQNRTCETQDAARSAFTNYKIGRTLLSMETSRSESEALPHLADSPPEQAWTDVVSEMKYVELVMVADNSEYKLHHRDLNILHTRMLEIANKMDSFYRVLNIRIVLVGVEVWSQKDKIVVSSDPAETLNRFLAWREKASLPRHDNAHLLTGVTFNGSAVGMATMNSICTADRSGGVNMDHSVSILSVASTISHQLGHNLGLNHAMADRECGQPSMGKAWIMENTAGFMPGLEFSKCSMEELNATLRQGGGKCLFNVPAPSSVFGEPRCGNLLVERGEQCDCGLTQECTDPCCNASSCQLMAGAECASDGLCCEQCMIKPMGTLCREPLGECDLPEYCSGDSAHCPANVFLQDGESCASGEAHCYGGECRTLQSQCQSMWGPGSSPAPDACFTKVNMRGDKYGNCGRSANGTYRPCTQRNSLCGTIQCQGGSHRPLVGSTTENITVKVAINGSEVTCRGTYLGLGDDIWEPVLVKMGTVCGTGKVCIKQQCQDVASLRAQSCKSKCGGHGVCNSNNNCHCDPGWAPPDCVRSGEGGSIDSKPVALENSGSTVSTTILVVLLVLLVLILLVFCYLKRQYLQRKLNSIFNKGSKCQYRPTQTSSQPRPQRPPPPHRTQSTELQLMPTSNQMREKATPGMLKAQHSPSPTWAQRSWLARPPSREEPDLLSTLPTDSINAHPPDDDPNHRKADTQERPPAPNRPLPADPRPPQAKMPNSGKPPPPRKPLPVKPLLPCQDPLLGVPTYPEQVIALPSRHAPPPPYTGRTHRV